MPGLCPLGQTAEWQVSTKVGNTISTGRIFGSFSTTFSNGFINFKSTNRVDFTSVSPQFHCVYNKNFDLPRQDKNFYSVWEEKAGLKKQTISSKIGAKNYLEKLIPGNICSILGLTTHGRFLPLISTSIRKTTQTRRKEGIRACETCYIPNLRLAHNSTSSRINLHVSALF